MVHTMIAIPTPRLEMRPFLEADALFLVGLMQEPAFVRFVGDRGVHDEASARAYMTEGPHACMQEHGFSLLCIVERTSGDAVGMCGLLKRPWLDVPDLGFAVSAAFSGNGYAQEAARAVLNQWVHPEGLERVAAIASPDNSASHRVLGAVGFSRKDDRPHPETGERLAVFEYPA